MKKYKKDKYSNKENFNMNFDFDDLDFEWVGEAIKNSVNSVVSSFSKGYKKDLPAIKDPAVCVQKPVEKNKYWLIRIGAVFAAMTLFAIGMDGIDSPGLGSNILGLLSLAGAVAAPVLMWKLSNNYKRLSINYARYRRELGSNTIISIRDLASAVSQSEEKTIQDLLYFMKQNYFKQARIVEDDSIFILDIPTFKLYKDKLDKIPQKSKEEIGPVEDINEIQAEDLIRLSEKSLGEIIEKSQMIKDFDFKSKIDPLIENTRDIINIIKKYPDKALNLNKFADFYLPTAAKLVESYQEFESLDTDDAKIRKFMEEIKGSIKTISEAFDKIKVDLIADKAMDVKTDMDTIELILKQEGLTEGDFNQ